MWPAESAGIPSNFSRMKSPETVHSVKTPFTMIARIMVAGSGAHLHHRTREMYVLDSEDQRIGFMAIDLPDGGALSAMQIKRDWKLRKRPPRFIENKSIPQI
jgi:hypothetical protein